ncbi:hypothetical protein VI01_18075 [Pantoea sp. SM3]|nr:hypothetical protein VI01_18075 [Pantoea sp. SM3]
MIFLRLKSNVNQKKPNSLQHCVSIRMPLTNARVLNLGTTSLVLYSDCQYTVAGISAMMRERFPQQPTDSTIIIVNACSMSLEARMNDVFVLRKRYGERTFIFVLTQDKDNYEIYSRIHFVSLRSSANALLCYIMSAVILHESRAVRLSLQSMQIIYMKSLGVEIADIASLMNRSYSTIKNNFSYCKRRLHIRSSFSERALIYIAKGIVCKQ